MYGAGDVRVIDVPDPVIQQPTDAIARVVRACICGSDLHPYHSMPVTPGGSSMGHEFIGVVEDTGGDVGSVKKGDLVIAPFAWSDGAWTARAMHTAAAVMTAAITRRRRWLSRLLPGPAVRAGPGRRRNGSGDTYGHVSLLKGCFVTKRAGFWASVSSG